MGTVAAIVALHDILGKVMDDEGWKPDQPVQLEDLYDAFVRIGCQLPRRLFNRVVRDTTVEAYKEEWLDVRRQPDHVTFRWKHPRKSIAGCRNPVYLDLDGALLSIRRIYPETRCGGWGQIISAQSVAQWMPRVTSAS